jgi:hypothetical protein
MRRKVFFSDRLRVLLIAAAAGFAVLTTCLPWFFVVKLSSEQAQLPLEHNLPLLALASGQLSSPLHETDSLIYHFIVNSDCSAYQQWQVLTQIHSARAIQQVGRYTWIVSGCPDQKGNDKDELTRSQIEKDLHDHFPSFQKNVLIPNVHFSPDFSNMSVYGGPFAGTKKRTFINRAGNIQTSNYGNHYHFNNKPNGLAHWAEKHYSHNPKEDEAIVLIDPDFLFLTPFTLSNDTRPFAGKPVAAAYGLGSQWLDFNRTAICGHASPCTKVTDGRSYSVGPPYIIHASDVVKLSQTWSKFVPPTYDQYPLLYAEMFAYSMAAAHLKMPHKLLKNLYSGCMVGWPKHTTFPGPSARAFVESGADLIQPKWDGPASCFLPPLIPPPFLHYCRRYAFENPNGTFFFLAKRKIPHDILDCRHDHLTLYLSQEKVEIVEGNQDWTTLAACAILRAVNYARNQHCSKKK